MGFFGKSKQIDDRPDVKARTKAAKAGVDVEGAVFVGRGVGEGGRDTYLAVHPDRVTLHAGKTFGSVMGGGSGSQTVPVARVSSVASTRDGIWQVVTVFTSGTELVFKTDVQTGPAVEAAVRSVLQ